MSEQHAPGRMVVGEVLIAGIEHVCVGVAGEVTAIAVTGKVNDHRVQQSRIDARRIAALWNACEQITTDELETIAATGGMLGPRDDVARIAQQRDDLLEALRRVLNLVCENPAWEGCGPIIAARSAIAKATGVAS